MWFIEMFSIASFIIGLGAGYMWCEAVRNKREADKRWLETLGEQE